MIIKLLKGIYYYLLGHVIAHAKYDKRYLKGNLFKGKLNGLCSPGWELVVKDAIGCRKLGINKNVRWPVSPRSTVVGAENIHFSENDLHIFQVPGCYFQGIGEIFIGEGTYVAPNVGLITSNHDFYNLKEHSPAKAIHIGQDCWIGMNAMVLPGVCLGEKTIVAAGAVVTKSFEQGNCVIAGNPARIIKNI